MPRKQHAIFGLPSYNREVEYVRQFLNKPRVIWMMRRMGL